MIAALFSMSVAAALTIPPGWSAAGPSRALLDPAVPDRGELREVVVSGGVGDPDELVFTLKAAGLAPTGVGRDGNAISLAFGDKLGRARSRLEEGQAVWAVVIAAPAYAGNLDPDAILTVALTSQAATWGAAAVANGPVPWSGQAQVGWEAVSAGATWAIDPGLVGTWEGVALVDGNAITYVMRFTPTGELIVTRKARKGKDEQRPGTWAAKEGLLRLTVTGAGGDVPYERLGSTLNLSYDGARITLRQVSP